MATATSSSPDTELLNYEKLAYQQICPAAIYRVLAAVISFVFRFVFVFRFLSSSVKVALFCP
jgi:hypothetical protein